MCAKQLRTLFVVCATCAATLFIAAPSASALQQFFYTSDLAPGNRAIGGYHYLYGVGYYTSSFSNISDSICVGAKTNGDGSGGNAIAFTCDVVPPNTSRWTAGGLSNYGYPTLINQSAHTIWGEASMNYRP